MKNEKKPETSSLGLDTAAGVTKVLLGIFVIEGLQARTSSWIFSCVLVYSKVTEI